MTFTYETNSPSYFSEKQANEVRITADSKVEAEHKLKEINDFGRNPKWTLKEVSER